MPTPLDVAFALLFAVVIAAAEALWFDRRFKRQLAAGLPDARRNAYRRAVVGQWALAIVAVALWARSGRPWRALGVVAPHDWRFALGIVVVAAVALLTAQQTRAIRRLTRDRREAVRGRLGEVELVLPHTPREYRWFIALSCTAGVCEELLYRGFLTWVVAAWAGAPAAIALVSVAFGGAHAYQGARGVVKTGAVGLVMSLVVLATGWLLPAMIVHALIDIGAGVLGIHVLGEAPAPTVLAAA